MELSPQHSLSSALQLACWHAVLIRYQIVSTEEAHDVPRRSIAPIWDLSALSASPGVSRETILKVVQWLALSLLTAGAGDGDAEMVDRGPLMWASVSVRQDLVGFQF